MRCLRVAPNVALAAAIIFAAPLAARASDLDLTPPKEPAHDLPLRPDLPGCDRWTDDCVTCTRTKENDAPVCSNIGIACQPKTIRCVGGENLSNGQRGK